MPKYEIRYFTDWGEHTYYCILWTSQGQNVFIFKPAADRSEFAIQSYEAVKQFERKEKFSSIKELYEFVLSLGDK